MILEFIKLIIALLLIVFISKFFLAKTIRSLAEYLNLKPHTVGNIAGFATSIPELLTTCVSCIAGLPGAGLYNILSSNVINVVQFLAAVAVNKNIKRLRIKAIRTTLRLVAVSVIIPLIFAILNIEMEMFLAPLLLVFFVLFIMINNQIHKTYLRKEDNEINKRIEKERKEVIRKRNVFKYIIILLISSILLYFISNFLGEIIENLCIKFSVSQVLIGVLLGVFTSIPELITFLESQVHHKKKKNSRVGLIETTNNLLMSNIMNLCIILPLGIILVNIFN